MKHLFLLSLLLISCSLFSQQSEEQLLRIPYTSDNDQSQREYFVYLPKGYENEPEKKWPVLMFLHGDGERGNGRDELDYVMIHGPLYEAWIQKRNLPFVMIVPQLHMFGRDTLGIGYINNRKREGIPVRLKDSIPQRPLLKDPDTRLTGKDAADDFPFETRSTAGWDNLQKDLMNMLDHTLANYNTDVDRVYLSGLSYGGRGTWYTAYANPDRFAAINPIVGFGHPDLMKPIAKAKIPVWEFTGGRDSYGEYYYAAINKLIELGHSNVRLSVHEDTGHVNTWRRIYEGEDIYNWFLQQHK